MNSDLSISFLGSLWRKEREHYRNVEVGTGVQSFVQKVFESPDIFHLKEGKLSTIKNLRKNEFIHEKKANQGRKADFVIYISPEVVIPVEAECYGNIQRGEKQLFHYQRDFERHYGILTDGYYWRFYNNNIFRSFALDDIFKKTSEFLEFWREYIKPRFYYLSFFEKTGQQSLFTETPLKVEENRRLFFQDITKLIESFNHKIKLEGYLEEENLKKRAKKAVELTYAYIIQFILYKTLVDNNFDDFAEEFSASVAAIHAKLKQERYEKILGIIDNISSTISKNIYRPFDTEQQFIRKRLLELYHSIENNLSDVSPWLDIFVFIKKYNFANVKNDIFGFIYENYLKELYEEQNRGQYFTDPEVVNFMLEQVGYTPKEIKRRYESDKNSVSIIDPACGSGTFLYSATDAVVKAFSNGNTLQKSKIIEEIVTNNIFGLDIEEFPLYLAEMSILMRLLPIIINEKYNNPIDQKIKVFKTRDSIAEFWDTAIRNTISDLHIEMQRNGGGLQLGLLENRLGVGYESYVRDEDDLKEMKHSLEANKIPRRRFDFVVGNPPYISYNECSKQKLLIFQWMKEGKFNAKLNDIYGVNLHSTEDRHKKNPPKPNLYAFFVALGIALLKDDGRLCFIIPQTILTAGDLDVIRYHLSRFVILEKIITFTGKIFIGRGLKQTKSVATSSLIFVIRRHSPSALHKIEVTRYKGINQPVKSVFQDIRNSKHINKRTIFQSQLLQNTRGWNYIKFGRDFSRYYDLYGRNTDDFKIYYDHQLSNQFFNSNFIFDIGYHIDEKKLIPNRSGEYYGYPKLENNWLIHSFRGYWPNDRKGGSGYKIKLLKTNQGYQLLDCQHKILWSYINSDRFVFSSLPLIWARNQICAIGSDNKEELQYLFALLNSQVNRTVLIALLKNESEKNFLLSTTLVKEFVRIPKIDKADQFIKDKVIKLTDQLLRLEEIKLSDLVNFSDILQQKFTSVSVAGSKLKMQNGTEFIELPVKGGTRLVTGCLQEKPYSLEELKQLPMVDFECQKKIKYHIDDLVFVLYFNVPIQKEDINNPEKIRSLCQTSHFYKIAQE